MTTTTPRPRLQQLRRTPLRDVFRLRLTGRLDARARVEAFDLPAPLSKLCLDVAARTKLWRLERADVAAELAGHFADGCEAGVDAEQLRRVFGDPVMTARLIRRAKKRDRPFVWRAAGWTLKGAGALVVFYIVAGLVMIMQRPQPSHDYREDLNVVSASIPEADRAWPVYERALAAMDAYPDDLTLPATPGTERWDEIVTYLEAQTDAFAVARDASQRRGFGYVLGTAPPSDQSWSPDEFFDETSVMNVQLPFLSSLRRLAMLLAADAWRAAGDGDGATVVMNIETMTRIAAHVREHTILINDLVALSVLGLAAETAQSIVWALPDALSSAELARLQAQLSSTDELLTVRLDGERIMFEDVLQRTFTDDGRGDGELTWSGLKHFDAISSMNRDDRPEKAAAMATFPVVRSLMLSRRELSDRYHGLMDELERRSAMPLWEQRSEPPMEMPPWATSKLEELRHLPLFLLVPAIEKAMQQGEITRERRDSAVVAIALRRFHRLHGAWPERIEELVPSLLEALPRDRMDGRPFRYRLEAGAPLVYSVGPDEDDDGGAALKDTYGRRFSEVPAKAPDGDWRLWPRLEAE